jgi:molecular chaperone GrpE
MGDENKLDAEAATTEPPVQATDEELETILDEKAAIEDEDATPKDPEPHAEQDADNGNGVTLLDPNPALTEAQNEINSLQARLRAVSVAYQNMQDEVKATKERLERQAKMRREMQKGETVSSLFEPLDNLHRSIVALKADEGASKDTLVGFTLVANQFSQAFVDLGLEQVPGIGHPFDPNLHEAISVLPVTDPAQVDQILQVFSAGYRVGSRLLRPSRVIIGKAVETEEAVVVEEEGAD